MATGGKICVLCGEDCSSRPRTKNPEGQYACEDCLTARREARAVKPRRRSPVRARPAQASVDNASLGLDADDGMGGGDDPYAIEDDAMGGLLDDLPDGAGDEPGAIREQMVCPSCGQPVMADAALCISCGTNLSTGKAARTKIEKAQKPRREKAQRPIGVLAGWQVALIIVGVAAVFGVLASLDPLAFAVAALLAGLGVLASTIAMIKAAFDDGDMAWGIVGICQIVPFVGGFCSLGFAFYYCIFGSERTSWKLVYWGAQLTLIVTIFGGIASTGLTFLEMLEDENQSDGTFGSMLEPAAAPAMAIEAARPGEDPLEVDWGLVAVADSILGTRLQEDPDHPEASAYRRLLDEGTSIVEYPLDVANEAVRLFAALGDTEREDVMFTGSYPP